MTHHVATAQTWLEVLREGTPHYKTSLAALHQQLVAGGLKLGDIGSSEEELEVLRLLGAKTAAICWLKLLQAGDVVTYEIALTALDQELASANLRPEDIGTNQVELKRFSTLGHKRSALTLIHHCPPGSMGFPAAVVHIRRHLAAGGLKPEDIGTTEAELDSFASATV